MTTPKYASDKPLKTGKEALEFAQAKGAKLVDNLSLDVRYWDTDAHDLGSIYDSRFVGTLKAVF